MRHALAAALFCVGCGSVSDRPPDARVDDSPDAESDPPDGPPPARCDPTAGFGEPVPMTGLNIVDGLEDSPFLTADEKTIYFSTARDGGVGGWDVWFATRDSLDDEFTDPSLLAGLNTGGMQRRPVITGDGLRIYADTHDGDYDISVSTRDTVDDSFGAFVEVPALNIGSVNDGDPYALPDGTVYFATDATGDGDIYRAEWDGADFETAVVVTGTDLGPGDLEASPVITPDELHLYFQSARAGSNSDGYDIWYATRDSVVEGFGEPVNIAALNSTDIDVPHWISADNCVLYFTRDVDTSGDTIDYDLFYAVRGD
jgi:Tol biopolymer transport system component